MSNDKPQITLAEIKNDAVFWTREYRQSGGMRDELVQISEEHYDWLMEVAASYPCQGCDGYGGDLLTNAECPHCEGSGKEYGG